MAVAIARPKLEGNIAVGDDRQIGFAEFGDPQGRAIFWLHGTPGARRQIPMEARVYAEQRQYPADRYRPPGIGSSTPYQYDTVFAFADDLRTIADTLGIDKMEVIGLSGGGPYTLACAAAMPDRVVAAGVLGGVAPTCGSDAIGGGVSTLGYGGGAGDRGGGCADQVGRERADPADPAGRRARAVRVCPDLAGGRPRLLVRPEFKAMFLDDLLNGSRKQLAAPFADIVVFSRDWGFRLDEVKVPVRWWHGDRDHIVPFAHGQHVVSRLPDAELNHLPGESHLAGSG